MKHIQLLLQAARFASERHSGQVRKGARAEPYINHPLDVACLIADVGMVDDIDILLAGLLHDTIEDCGVTAAELTELFGERATGFVVEVTDDKDLPKARRKELQVEHAPHKSMGAATVKLADKISNCRDVLDNPATSWTDERRREYIAWGLRVVNGLRGANAPLEAEFDRIVARAEIEMGVKFT